MRPSRQIALLCVYGAVLAFVSYGLARGDRLPLSSWELIAFPACALAAAFWLGRWYALILVFAPAVALVAFGADQGPVVFFELLFGIPVMAVASLVGVGARKGIEHVLRRRDKRRLRAAPPLLGIAAACAASAPVAIALAQQGDIVRQHRSNPLIIDEHAGRVDGVGIGDPAARVIAAFGTAPRWTITQPDSPLDLKPGDYLGSTYVPSHGRGTPYVLRFPHAAFDVTGGRVNFIQLTDTNAQTRRGIGPGDSIALVQDLYPQLHCAEGDAGEDEPIPFRFCTGQTGPHSYMYFSGNYTKHGTPITDITITPVKLNS